MHTVSSFPLIRSPRWWDHALDFLGVGFAFQPKLLARARVVGKRFRPWESFCLSGFVSVLVVIKEAWLLEVKTPHGSVEVEVSKEFYDLTRKGDSLKVRYQLHRLYNQTGQLKASLLQ